MKFFFLPFQSTPCCGTSNSEYSMIPKEFWDSERAKEGQEEPRFRTSVWILWILSLPFSWVISVISLFLLPAQISFTCLYPDSCILDFYDLQGKTSIKHTFATTFWLGQAGGHSCTPDFHHIPIYWKEDAVSVIGSSKERFKRTGSRKVHVSPARIILPFIQANCITEARERKRRNQGPF